MSKKLKDLVITKVALVPKGSNPESDITFFKSADPVAKVTFNEVLDGQPDNVREALWKIYDLSYTLNTAVSYSFYGKKAIDDIRLSITQFAAAANAVLDDLVTNKSVKKEDVDVLMSAVITKTREFLAGHQEPPMKKIEEMSKEELVQHAQELQTKLDKAPAPAVPAAPTPEELAKSAELPEGVRKALESQAAVIKEANERADRAENMAKAEKGARELTEMTTFVSKELAHVPGKAEDIAKGLLESKEKLSKESYDLVVASMKAGSAAIAKSTQEVGVGEGAAATGSAYEKLMGIAKALKDATPTLTDAQAFSKACDQNADLYVEHRQETKNARR